MMKLIPFLSLIFCCVSCSAQTIQFPFSDKGWEHQVDGLLPEKWHSFDRVKLYETKFENIERFYGESNRFKVSDKNYSPDLQCYLIGDDYVAVFQSGPLGGWSTITGILIAKKAAYNNKNCAKSIELPAEIADIQIGDTKEKVYDMLGQPSFNEADLLAYRYEQEVGSKIPNSGKVIYVTSGIEIGLVKEKVSWIRVYWQEST